MTGGLSSKREGRDVKRGADPHAVSTKRTKPVRIFTIFLFIGFKITKGAIKRSLAFNRTGKLPAEKPPGTEYFHLKIFFCLPNIFDLHHGFKKIFTGADRTKISTVC